MACTEVLCSLGGARLWVMLPPRTSQPLLAEWHWNHRVGPRRKGRSWGVCGCLQHTARAAGTLWCWCNAAGSMCWTLCCSTVYCLTHLLPWAVLPCSVLEGLWDSGTLNDLARTMTAQATGQGNLLPSMFCFIFFSLLSLILE